MGGVPDPMATFSDPEVMLIGDSSGMVSHSNSSLLHL
jgi:hypothetical protein